MINSRFALALLGAHAALGTLAGAAIPGAPAAPEAAAPSSMAGYQLKNRSSYHLPESTRPPFWPIGWVKRPVGGVITQEAPAPTITLDPEQFNVTSILLGAPSLAVINGRAYSAGEYIRPAKPKDKAAPAAGALPPGVKVRIARIVDGIVSIEVNGQVTDLTLRRPQLSNHRPEDEESELLKPLSER
jgi:hypothetical protein